MLAQRSAAATAGRMVKQRAAYWAVLLAVRMAAL
jgi:hypothetical protein